MLGGWRPRGHLYASTIIATSPNSPFSFTLSPLLLLPYRRALFTAELMEELALLKEHKEQD